MKYDWRRQLPAIEAAVDFADLNPITIVHHHNGGPMLISLMPQLIEWNRSLVAKGCRLWLTTTIREPIAHFSSRMAFTNEEFGNFHRVLRGPSYQTSHLLFNHAGCPHGNYTCSAPRRDFSIKMEPIWQIKHGVALRAEFGLVAEEVYISKALAILEMFDIVGITSELSSFVRNLENILCWPIAPVQTRNISPEKRKERWKIDVLTNSQFEAIRKFSAMDQVLYERAVKLKDRKISLDCAEGFGLHH